ncbi:MAG: peptidase family [Phenylobacterium sp.]|nr:peptidase family [Phenylobacterium sp.]
MSDTDLAAPARHGFGEGMLGAAVALVAITVAHAALPDSAPPSRSHPAAAAVVRIASPPPPAPPPVLIAFQAPMPDGEIGSPFGLRQLPWEDRARLHAGVDMVAPDPEPVLAAADGVVSRMGEDPGYGRFVQLTHAEGLTSLYGHLDRFAPGVAAGTAVKAGTAVGRLGSTGTSTGAHLHFEIHDRDGRPLNPVFFLGKSFARAGDLPLSEARRVPRGVRVAYVSRIPRNKQALMEARLEPELAQAAADGAVDAGQAPNAGPVQRHGRVHTRLRL